MKKPIKKRPNPIEEKAWSCCAVKAEKVEVMQSSGLQKELLVRITKNGAQTGSVFLTLKSAVEFQRKPLEEHGNLPDKLHVLTSWPYATKKAIGQCYAKTWTKDESVYIAISPKLGNDLVEVLAVLLHELIHAQVGVEKAHGKPFRRLATKMGLVGPMRTTEPGPELTMTLQGMVQSLGEYPHVVMQDHKPETPRKPAKKQIIKFVSPVEPTYTCWLTPAQAAKVGPPICPISMTKMVLAEEADGVE